MIGTFAAEGLRKRDRAPAARPPLGGVSEAN